MCKQNICYRCVSWHKRLLNTIRDSSLRCSQRISLLPERSIAYLTCFVCCRDMGYIGGGICVCVWALEELQTGDKGSLLHDWNRCTIEASHFPLSARCALTERTTRPLPVEQNQMKGHCCEKSLADQKG